MNIREDDGCIGLVFRPFAAFFCSVTGKWARMGGSGLNKGILAHLCAFDGWVMVAHGARPVGIMPESRMGMSEALFGYDQTGTFCVLN